MPHHEATVVAIRLDLAVPRAGALFVRVQRNRIRAEGQGDIDTVPPALRNFFVEIWVDPVDALLSLDEVPN